MLSEEQKRVVENFSDNILMLARAGSGKTYTVAQKISAAITRGIKPEEILAVTFTVKAAEELKNDVESFTLGGGVKVFTIHGFCYHVVREYAKKEKAFKDPIVADEVDAGEIMAEVLNAAKQRGEYDFSGETIITPKNLVKIVSKLKHERHRIGYDWFYGGGYAEAMDNLIKTEGFLSDFTVKKSDVKVTDYALVSYLKRYADDYMRSYENALLDAGLMDYDDLIFCADAIISKDESFKGRYKLIIVDEMQDTSLAEYGVMRKLFGGAEVLMCGDEFQTIYAWRGSEPERIISDFVSNFSAKAIHLDKNRRSSPYLTYCGEYYLEKTFGYKSDNLHIGEDFNKNDLEILALDGYDKEAEKIYDRLKRFEGKNYEICVMARSNRYVAALRKRLERINENYPAGERLKFFTAETDYRFFKKPIVKDFLAFMRLAVNPDDVPSIERVAADYPGISRHFLNSIKDLSSEGLTASAFLTSDAHLHGDEYYSLIKAYKEDKIVVYDLETTGLDVDEDEFIQISALKFGVGGDSGELNIFVMPKRGMSAEAEKVHGYGIEKLKELGAVEPIAALKRFAEFAKGCVTVGHNSSSFDDLILDRISGELNIPVDISARYDTLKIAARFRPDLKNRKLSTLCEEFSIINERAHDAFSDVTATRSVLGIFLEKYIIPTASSRKSFTEKHAARFSDFYRDNRTIAGYLKRKDYFSAFKTIGGIISGGGKTVDRESANELYLAFKECALTGDGIASARRFLSAAALSGSQIDVMIKKYDKFPLITVHQSKGSEFDEVILAGADSNEFPSYAARLTGCDDEEKRVFYVALSRAKKKMTITYCSAAHFGEKTYPREPSPYIKNLPNETAEKP